ncbi:MAG: DUF4390 domain-containing protein [Spirochaetales bacterium]|nr:DUF4390 domain-containing protein [Spirochaetales bacterium]
MSRNDSGILLDISITDFDSSILRETVDDGLRCGISFTVQIYQKKAALADKFITEITVKREGKWDPFSKSYLISQNDVLLDSAGSFEAFFIKLINLADYFIPFEKSAESEYYILCRVRVETLKLVPPFQILGPGMSMTFPSTSWEKHVIE